MNKKIKIIKRAERDLLQAERNEKALASGRNEAKEASPLQITRTIKAWVTDRHQRATDELLAAQSLKRLAC